MTEYTSIKIPKTLVDKIQLKMHVLGHRTVSEFVLESARIRLYKLEESERYYNR